jgi:ABC-type enterochelin transport system permease subunit
LLILIRSSNVFIMRIILGIIVAMLGVGLAQGITQYVLDAPTGTTTVSAPQFRVIGAVTLGIFGAVGGAGIGCLASIFSFPFPQSVILSFVVSLLASIAFFFFLEEMHKQITLIFLLSGTVFGTLASIINYIPDQFDDLNNTGL